MSTTFSKETASTPQATDCAEVAATRSEESGKNDKPLDVTDETPRRGPNDHDRYLMSVRGEARVYRLLTK